MSVNFIIQGDSVFTERDAFTNKKAGSSRENFWLKGLKYKLTVKVTGTIRAIYLFSSDEFGDETNRFDFTDTGNGVFIYEEIAGEGATSLSVATDPNANFTDGVGFYFRVKIIGISQDIVVDRRFWVRDVIDFFLFGEDKLPYISPFPVLVATLAVSLSIGTNALNGAGVTKRGGVETAQVFDTPGNPSTGGHVATIPETPVANLTEIILADRTNSGKVLNFVPPPGAPDFSNFYHFVTFRLRAKAASPSFRDIPVILFGAQKCKSTTPEYGYDGSGITSPPPLLLLTIIPFGPPPKCSSRTQISTGSSLNPYSESFLEVFDLPVGGNKLARAKVKPVVDLFVAEVARVDFDDNEPEQPVAGFAELHEVGPSRTSTTRIEFFVYGCELIPREITITGGGTSTITKTGGDPFDPAKTYIVRKYDNKYGGTPSKTFPGQVIDDNTIEFDITGDESGFWEVTEDGIIINTPREEKSLIIDPGWSDPDIFSDASQSHINPGVKIFADDTALLIYRFGDISPTDDVYYFSKNNGTSWNSQARWYPNSALDKTRESNQMAFDHNRSTDSVIMAQWRSEVLAGPDRFAILVNIFENGSFLGETTLFNELESGRFDNDDGISCAIGTNKAIMVFSMRNDTSGNGELIARVWTRSVGWGSEQLIYNTTGSIPLEHVRVKMNSSDDGMIVFEDGGANDIKAVRFVSGVFQSAVTVVNIGMVPSATDITSNTRACLAFSESGKALATFLVRDSSFGSQVGLAFFNGSSWSLLSPTPVRSPDIFEIADYCLSDLNGNNEALLVYTGFQTAKSIFARHFDGTSLGAEIVVDDTSNNTYSFAGNVGHTNYRIVQINEDGNGIVVYSDNTATDTWYSRRWNGSTWEAREVIEAATAISFANMYVDANNTKAIFAYTNQDASPNTIKVRSRSMGGL